MSDRPISWRVFGPPCLSLVLLALSSVLDGRGTGLFFTVRSAQAAGLTLTDTPTSTPPWLTGLGRSVLSYARYSR